MSAYAFLNLLYKLGKRDKMYSLPSIVSLIRNSFINSIILEYACWIQFII